MGGIGPLITTLERRKFVFQIDFQAAISAFSCYAPPYCLTIQYV